MTLEEAVASVERQLLARGRDGVLRDVQVHLIESGDEALLWADWTDDPDPPRARFVLPRHYADDEFPEDEWVERAIEINRAAIIARGSCRWLQ
jgi:hypothetical protein